MQKRIVDLEIMLKRITTKESDIVPLMEKVRTSIRWKSKGFQYVLDGSTLYLLTVQT
jgi:hypothetical protein